MKFNKKAALDLSINSIVVLILAITMLGLGLGFMYKMFGGTTEKLEKMSGELESQMKEQLKESGKRLALETTVVDMKKSSKRKIAFAIKNDLGEDKDFSFSGGNIGDTGSIDSNSAVQCYQNFAGDSATDIQTTKIVITAPGDLTVKGDETRISAIQIEAKSNAQADTYQCSFIIGEPEDITEYARVDFEVNVK